MSKEEQRPQKGKAKTGVIFPQALPLANIPSDYPDFIGRIKDKIATQRLKSILNANTEMIVLYWHIGNAILKKQTIAGWGAKVIDRMSYDIKVSFPEMSGFSPRNLKYMRKFAEAWPDLEIVQRTVAQIPWRSNITLLDKLNEEDII